MSLSFNHIPESLRYPGVYIETDGSKAGLSDDMPVVLIVAQKLATGTAVAGELTIISSPEDAMAKAGGRSMAADMVREFRKNDKYSDIFLLPLSDNGAGVAATATITVTAAATADGTLALYIDEQLVSVAITAGMTTAAIATAIAAAVNAAVAPALLAGDNIPCDAAAATSVVTLTALHKGTCGNNIDVRLNLYQEQKPAGLGLNISGFAGGTGDPVVPNLDVLLEQRWFKAVALGINNLQTLTAWHQVLLSRYQPPVQQETQIYTALRGDYATAYSFGESVNFELLSILSIELNPVTTWRAAAQYAGAAAWRLNANPSKSLEDTELVGMVGVTYHTWTNVNSLLFKGISVLKKDVSGKCYILRPISTYKKRPDGSADDAYLDINTVATLGRIRYEQRTAASQQFIGTTAAKDAEGFRPGLKITTVDSVRALLLRVYKNKLQYDLGIVQDYPFYKDNLVVNQNPNNPSRFDFRDTPVITSPYYILAGANEFRKVAE